LEKFGIRKYVVRSANLEEVFIAIGEKEHIEDDINKTIIPENSQRSSSFSQRSYSGEKVTCCRTYTTF